MNFPNFFNFLKSFWSILALKKSWADCPSPVGERIKEPYWHLDQTAFYPLSEHCSLPLLSRLPILLPPTPQPVKKNYCIEGIRDKWWGIRENTGCVRPSAEESSRFGQAENCSYPPSPSPSPTLQYAGEQPATWSNFENTCTSAICCAVRSRRSHHVITSSCALTK
jgi:hypothetical protein